MVSDRKTGSFGKIYEKIRFKGNRKKKRFPPKQIKAYKIGDTSYRSIFLDGKQTFLKVESEGYVNYYTYELQEQGEQLVLEIDYLQKENSDLLVRATQGLFGLKRKRLAQFFGDCPILVQKIQNKEFRYVFEVVDFYNNWKSEGNP